jgi:hypothetical protein
MLRRVFTGEPPYKLVGAECETIVSLPRQSAGFNLDATDAAWRRDFHIRIRSGCLRTAVSRGVSAAIHSTISLARIGSRLKCQGATGN